MTATMTAKLASAASIEGRTPGRRRISRSGRRRLAARAPASARRSSRRSGFGSGRTKSDEHEADEHEAEAASQERERVAVEIAAREQRAEDGRPEDRAEDRSEEDERDPSRAPRGRVHVARGRAREERGSARGAHADQPDDDRRRRLHGAAERREQRRRRRRARSPSASTGTRPKRSIARPAGSAASAPEPSTIAGPSPSSPFTPMTSTNVSDATAAESWSIAELAARAAARSAVFRRIGRSEPRRSHHASVVREAAPKLRGAAVGRVAHVRPAQERASRHAADREHASAARQLAHEGAPGLDLARVGARFDRSSPGRCGWVGTTFQRRTSSPSPSSASTRWTIVALASRGRRRR